MNPWLALFIGWLAMALAMLLLWAWQRRSGETSLVDVVWTFGVAALGLWFAAVEGQGDAGRRWLVIGLIVVWAARLGSYVLVRVRRLAEDGRYTSLKSDWGADVDRRMFWFFQSQAVACAVFAVPLLLALLNERPLGWLDALAVVIWLAAVTGETLADRQLARFRHDQRNRGCVCRSGLWAWSRHPNYFFEWLHWWSYVCLAWGAPWGWLAVIGPAVMLYLLLRVTGIPPTEAQAVRSRGEAYREYQRTTSAFVPWPPRRSREQ